MLPQFLIKPLLFIVAISAVAALGYYKGVEHTEDKYKAAIAAQAQENAEKLAAILLQSDAKTRALTNEIRKLKKGNELPDYRVLLSADFCRMYNDSAGMPQGACPPPVPLAAVADTTAANFAACRQNAIWLEECQAACGH